MQTDTDFDKFYDMMGHYINAVYIKTAQRIRKRGATYNPLDEDLRDTTKQSIHYKYIETYLNMSVDTFKATIENKNYKKR